MMAQAAFARMLVTITVVVVIGSGCGLTASDAALMARFLKN